MATSSVPRWMQARALRTMALAVATVLTVLIIQWGGTTLSQWDERIGGLSWRFGAADQQERRVVVVDVDEASVQSLGPWPWPRERMAQLLQRLDEAGVGLILLDVLFEDQRSGDQKLRQRLGSATPTVAAQLFSLDPEKGPLRGGVLQGALPWKNCPAASMAALGYLGSEPGLLPPTLPVGHITPLLDADGSIRQIPALLCYDHQAYAALPLAGLLAQSDAQPRLVPGQGWLAPQWWLMTGDWRVPLGEQGQLRVSYQVPRAGFLSISAKEILNDQVDRSLLKGAWVIVGSTALGAADAVPTPQGGAVGGVEVHAQVLSALLDERTPYVPQAARFWPWLTGALAGLVLLAGLRQPRSGWLLPGVAVLLLGGLFGAHTLLLLWGHWWFGWVTPGLFTVLAATLLGSAELVRVRFERERLYRNLASYLPETVAREVALRGPSAQIQAARREGVVLMTDLRNFSAYCEGRPPEETATVLHLFYTTAELVVRAHGGEIQQLVGDELMATWTGLPAHAAATQSLAAAVELYRSLSAQLPTVSSRRTPLLDVGIGLELGTMLMGSFGSAARRVHTVLGETVTMAANLQKLTGDLGYPILLGPALAGYSAQSPPLQPLGEFLLPGLVRPQTLYAYPVEVDQQHLRLVLGAENERAAG